ncbi:MAG: hypothetical protein ACRDC6_17760 [Shewanella sp.]
MQRFLLLGIALFSLGGNASQRVLEHSANAASAGGVAVVASGYSALEGTAASGQLASGVAAVPLKGIGAVGSVAEKAGNKLLGKPNEPLSISEEAVTAGPPPKTE